MEPLAWVRVAKDRMVSGPYTAWCCAGTWLLWFGLSDQHHHAKTLGRFCKPDEAYLAAERHAKL